METVGIRRICNSQVADAVREAVADVGGMSNYVEPGTRVLIKPNLVVSSLDWRTGSTVNPAVVEAVAMLAWEAGAVDVLIGEGSGVGEETTDAFRALGYNEIAQRCGARLVDLNQDAVEVDWPSGVVLKQIGISRTALDADVLIDVPVLKTHCQAVVSLSLKNMKGVVNHRWKRKIHFLGLAQGIVDLNMAIAPRLVVVDGTVGQEGPGPVAGDPVEMNLILAGANRVAIDAVCCWVMGIDPTTVEHMGLASEAGLGPLDRKQIEIKGDSLERVRRPFKLPAFDLEHMYNYEGVSAIEGTACSGCTGSLALALRDMKESGELAEIVKAVGHVTIVFGADANIPEAHSDTLCLYVGKCQSRSRDLGAWVPGCPPGLGVIMDILREAAGFPKQCVPVIWEDVPGGESSHQAS